MIKIEGIRHLHTYVCAGAYPRDGIMGHARHIRSKFQNFFKINFLFFHVSKIKCQQGSGTIFKLGARVLPPENYLPQNQVSPRISINLF